MLALELLEYKVYKAVAIGDRSEGRSMYWGMLENELGHPDGTILLRLLKELSDKGLLELKKWTDRGFQTYPQTALNEDEFFFHGDFRLLMTSAGQRRFEELEQKYKAEDHIDKALARERNHFETITNEVRRDVQSEIQSVSLSRRSRAVNMRAALPTRISKASNGSFAPGLTSDERAWLSRPS